MVSHHCLNQVADFVEVTEEFDPLIPVAEFVKDIGLLFFCDRICNISAEQTPWLKHIRRQPFIVVLSYTRHCVYTTGVSHICLARSLRLRVY